MHVAREHSELFVPADCRNFYDVETLLEQARHGFVAQIVEVQTRDRGPPAQMAPGLDDRALGVGSARLVDGLPWPSQSRWSTSRARVDSGTSRESPFFVIGKCATLVSRSMCSQSSDSSSLRRMPVSIASTIRSRRQCSFSELPAPLTDPRSAVRIARGICATCRHRCHSSWSCARPRTACAQPR